MAESHTRPFRAEPYRELVGLDEASAAAYQVVAEPRAPVRDPGTLEEVRRAVALALSRVAPVVETVDGRTVPLSEAELLGRLQAQRTPAEALRGLYIRRIDLLRAVEVLKRTPLAL